MNEYLGKVGLVEGLKINLVEFHRNRFIFFKTDGLRWVDGVGGVVTFFFIAFSVCFFSFQE